MTTKEYDLLAVGGGTAGLVSAAGAAYLGVEAALTAEELREGRIAGAIFHLPTDTLNSDLRSGDRPAGVKGLRGELKETVRTENLWATRALEAAQALRRRGRPWVVRADPPMSGSVRPRDLPEWRDFWATEEKNAFDHDHSGPAGVAGQAPLVWGVCDRAPDTGIPWEWARALLEHRAAPLRAQRKPLVRRSPYQLVLEGQEDPENLLLGQDRGQDRGQARVWEKNRP